MTVTRPTVLHGLAFLVVGLTFWLPTSLAHMGGGAGVETRFGLPGWVPWVTGAGIVALSFVVVCAYLTRDAKADAGHTPHSSKLDTLSGLDRIVAAAFAAFFVLAILPLFVPTGTSGFPETFLWVVMWGILPLVAYLFANPWGRANPFILLEPLARRVRGVHAIRSYPERLAAWPAVFFVVALTGLEVASRWSPGPRALAGALLAYAIFTFAGIIVFGATAWLARAEVFTVMLRMWGALGPWGGPKGSRLRSPTRGIRDTLIPDASHVALVVAMLYGVNFDGFLATRSGNALFVTLAGFVPDRVAFLFLLLAGYGTFLGAFWLCARRIRHTALSLEPVGLIAGRFAASLIPIAVGYHLAHNLFYLMESAPQLLLSFRDPLGLGAPQTLPAWRIPETWGPIVAATQLGLIVAGHILAVTAAHRLAFDGFTSRVQAIQSEVPLTLVMIFYTLIGLWILTSPGITGVLAA